MSRTRTTCPYCGVGCGIEAVSAGKRAIVVKGDRAHPANYGRLCSKGTHLGETVGLEGRLLHPEIGGERVGWDEATALVAGRFSATIAEYGPDSVAFYVSGQLLTEDYYVANKLMKGFIGSANIDTNSRLCMASAVAAHNRAFGEDIVPCSYSDLEEADLILLVGSNTAWCHPVIWQRIEKARKERGTKLVVIDPRRTETAECADLHIAVKPDGDIALFNALLAEMRARGRLDGEYLAANVECPEGFWERLKGHPAEAGIGEGDFAALAALVSAGDKMVTLFSQGVNQSACGTDKGNAIINLHLATGRIGKPGTGPFSITGQPNAMGGREVGGLASTLACHMGFSDEERTAAKDFWGSPAIAPGPGLKAVDMFRAVHEGRIKALWIMATNPAVSMPDASFVREALERCEFVVVSDVIANTDTGVYADVKLPALAWAEKDGMVTNSERVMSRQRALFDPPGEALPDWKIVADVARAMGHGAAFGFAGMADVFREYCAQTAFRNDGRRLLDLGEWANLSDEDYAAWEPRQWGGISPFAEGRYPIAGGRARLVEVVPPETDNADPNYPLRLNTGRYRDQWHTMTRTGLSPRLSRHRSEPLVEIHADDAEARGLVDGDLARIATPRGSSIFRVLVSEAQNRGEIFAPMHWTDRMSGGGRTGLLTDGRVDPLSGQPAFKDCAAEAERVSPDWRAFLVVREMPDLPPLLYWTRTRREGGWLVELAGNGDCDIDAILPGGNRLEAVDIARGMRRLAVIDSQGRLSAALFVTHQGTLPPRDWIAARLDTRAASGGTELLAARPGGESADQGAIVCVCFDVGIKRILAAVAEQRLASVEEVGSALRAGTNCGSCRPEIARLIAAAPDLGEQRVAAE